MGVCGLTAAAARSRTTNRSATADFRESCSRETYAIPRIRAPKPQAVTERLTALREYWSRRPFLRLKRYLLLDSAPFLCASRTSIFKPWTTPHDRPLCTWSYHMCERLCVQTARRVPVQRYCSAGCCVLRAFAASSSTPVHFQESLISCGPRPGLRYSSMAASGTFVRAV